MPVKRKLWNEGIRKNHTPNWHCPICEGGYLKQTAEALHYFETADSIKDREHPAFEPDWIKYRFSTLLMCNNELCKEPVAVTGIGRVEEIQTSQDGDVDYVDVFYPTHVCPSPALIPLGKGYPTAVVEELKMAFVSSWEDFSSAGNHIRSAVEILLDHLKEPDSKIGRSGKSERLSLHARILNHAARDKKLSDSLLAVKWLGNAGSHADKLSREDIFDALDIIELNLEDLFGRNRDRVNSLVAAINQNKGPVNT